MSFKKKLLLAASVISLLALLVSAGSLSYFSDTDDVTNVFKIGELTTTITEPKWPGGDKPYYPGVSYDKNPTVNAIDGNIYFRLKVELLDGNDALITDTDTLALIWSCIYYDSSDDGANGTNGSNSGGITAGLSYTKDRLDTLVKSGDVVRYYNIGDFELADGYSIGDSTVFFNYTGKGTYILAEGKTATLFTDIAVPYDISDEDYQKLLALSGKTFKIKITVQAVQAEIIDVDSEDNADKANAAYKLMDEMWESSGTSTLSLYEVTSSDSALYIDSDALSLSTDEAEETTTEATTKTNSVSGSAARVNTVSSSDTDNDTDLNNKSTANYSVSRTISGGGGGGGSTSKTNEETTTAATETEIVTEQTLSDEAADEQATEESTEETTEEVTEQVIEEATAEEADIETAEEPSEETVDETAGESVDESAEQPVEETVDEPVDLGESVEENVETAEGE